METLGCTLFALPFGGIVTTNYDHSQHDACALIKKRSPLQLELEGRSLLGGADQTSFFIARIHGSAESPASMVLYPSSYRDLKKNNIYSDFLTNLFRERPCLFVGFSFLDPAIDHVLTTYKERRMQLFETSHVALLPSDSSADMHQRLSDLSIKAHFYDAADGHKALWQAFRKAASEAEKIRLKKQGATGVTVGVAQPAFQHYLAFIYAQQKMVPETQPVLEQARDGIVLSAIQDGGKDGITTQQLEAKIRAVLSLNDEEAQSVAQTGTARLFTNKEIRIEGDVLIAVDQERNEIEKPIGVLIDGLLARLNVREGMTPAEKDRQIASRIIEQALVVRAWDLAAHWAGGGSGYGDNLYSTLREIVGQMASEVTEKRRAAIERCAIDLLTLPTQDEADHLAELSRAAFALQFVLSSSRQSLQRSTLPEKVYFDASVLLPAIVTGHPLSRLYMGAIQRLKEAARGAGFSVSLCVGRPFLNEIISHRDIAVQIAEENNLDDLDSLQKIIAFYGAENTNVFVAAYAGAVGAALTNGRPHPSFKKFLQTTAPYKTEANLEYHLFKSGFSVVPMDYRRDHNHEYVSYFGALLTSYEKLKDDLITGKHKVLVEHEAMQMVCLRLDRRDGIHSVFVSNDRKLRRAAMMDPITLPCVGAMLPPEGFVGLIDIIAGIKADRQGLVRLVWASPRKDADRAIRDFFVRRALELRDAAMAKAIPRVIEEIVESATKALEKKSINISDGNHPQSVRETADFMDRFEREFYAKMQRIVEKSEKK